ncbi:hypothetical protein Tco_0940581 [Tanacetum coccineum]|uniref:Uncharacterized protein n=1 Tax=Tanacetum coccineum TaxID=301880 RepID=A0ABQ5DND6_9ASTR
MTAVAGIITFPGQDWLDAGSTPRGASGQHWVFPSSEALPPIRISSSKVPYLMHEFCNSLSSYQSEGSQLRISAGRSGSTGRTKPPGRTTEETQHKVAHPPCGIFIFFGRFFVVVGQQPSDGRTVWFGGVFMPRFLLDSPPHKPPQDGDTCGNISMTISIFIGKGDAVYLEARSMEVMKKEKVMLFLQPSVLSFEFCSIEEDETSNESVRNAYRKLDVPIMGNIESLIPGDPRKAPHNPQGYYGEEGE